MHSQSNPLGHETGQSIPAQRQERTVNLSELTDGNITNTSRRFSLIRQGAALEGDPADVRVTSVPESGPVVAERLLVVDKRFVDFATYNALAQASVPQLEMSEQATEQYVLFKIPTGSKMLSREALHGRPSDATYIGDEETFRDAGHIYGTAWTATDGKLILADAADNPLDHLALHTFRDEDTVKPYLRLCPPYATSMHVPDHSEASHIFGLSLASYPPNLVESAMHGFLTGSAGAVNG